MAISEHTLQVIEKIRQTIKDTRFMNKTFIAGGFVRDMILGLDNKDIDICVEISGGGGILLAEFLAKELNGTNVVIFERFGTAQTVIDGLELEFVMTRRESYNNVDDRNPDVVFGTIQEDVFRRDLTINSLLLNISTGEVLDLKNGIIRTTSDPSIIFDEDPLRVLRVIRFSSRFGFTIEEEAFKNIKIFASKIKTLSSERVRDELMKMLSGNGFKRGIELLIELDLIQHIGLPELLFAVGMNQNSFHTKDVLGHILDVVENSKPTSLHRLAALLHDIGKVKTKSIDDNNVVHFYDHEYISKEITERFMKELKFSNEEIELVSSAVVNHMRVTSDITPKKIRKIRSELGDEKFEFLMDLCEADRLSHAENNIDHITKAREIKEKEVNITSSNLLVNGKEKEVNITSSNLLVNGKEIMEIFDLKPSKKVGELLNMVSDMMFENPNITKEEIIILLKNNNNENN